MVDPQRLFMVGTVPRGAFAFHLGTGMGHIVRCPTSDTFLVPCPTAPQPADLNHAEQRRRTVAVVGGSRCGKVFQHVERVLERSFQTGVWTSGDRQLSSGHTGDDSRQRREINNCQPL